MGIGTDPELFIKSKFNPVIRSAHVIKNWPTQSQQGSVVTKTVRDGVAVELQTNPTYCRDWLVPSLGTQMGKIEIVLDKTFGDRKAVLSSAPMAMLSKKDLADKDAPEDITIFGCDPDNDAYKGVEKAPVLVDGDRRRYTCGHIHLGYKFFNTETAKRNARDERGMTQRKILVQKQYEPEMELEIAAMLSILCDYQMGLTMVAILGKTFAAGESERRKFYGQAGSFRVQPHGMEYRALSGRLLLHPVVAYVMYGGMKRIETLLMRVMSTLEGDPRKLLNDKVLDELKAIMPLRQLEHTINSHDYVTARKFWDQFGIELDGNYKYMTWLPAEQKTIAAIIEGDKQTIHFKDDVAWNWGIKPEWNYTPTSHEYWGHETCSGGFTDEKIFPQRKFVIETSSYWQQQCTKEQWCGCPKCNENSLLRHPSTRKGQRQR